MTKLTRADLVPCHSDPGAQLTQAQIQGLLMVKAKIAVCPGMFVSKSVKKSEYFILGKVAPGTVLKLIVR